MEHFFNDLQQQIAGKMGDAIALIDEDCGQLEALANGEDQYPVTFPCVLIGHSPNRLGECEERSPARKDDSHRPAGFRLLRRHPLWQHAGTARGRTPHAGKAFKLLSARGWRFDGCDTVLIRRTSRQFSLPGGIKVYETEYITTVADEIQNNES